MLHTVKISVHLNRCKSNIAVAKRQTERINKISFHYRGKLRICWMICKNPNKKTACLKGSWGTKWWNHFFDSNDRHEEYEFIKIVLDARHANSNTDQPSESWLVESFAAQFAGAKINFKAAFDFMYEYAHATLLDEAVKLTGFPSGGWLFGFVGGFLALNFFLFFTQKLTIFFEDLIQQPAVAELFHLLLMSNSQILNDICCNLSNNSWFC